MPPSIALLFAMGVIILIIGMILGYVGNDSAETWRRRFEAERAFYADYRARNEARQMPRATNEPPPPIAFPPPGMPPPALPPAAPVPAAAEPGTREILRINGIDAALADRLEALGVTTIHDLATMSHEDEMALELRLGLNAGTITRDQWRSQAQLLDGTAAR